MNVVPQAMLPEERCLEVLRRARGPEAARCPRCRSKKTGPMASHRLKTHPQVRRLLCHSCGHQFNDLSRTPFERSRVSLSKWFVVIHVLFTAKGVSARQLARSIGVAEKTALHMVKSLSGSPLARRIARAIRKEMDLLLAPAAAVRAGRQQPGPSAAEEFFAQQRERPAAQTRPPPSEESILLRHTLARGALLAAPAAVTVPKQAQGAFLLVLHSHLPYARSHGRWPHGEEWVHQAMAESYLPLLNAMYGLRARGEPFKLALSFTPVLLEQLADPLIKEHFVEFLHQYIERARLDAEGFHQGHQPHFEALARLYQQRYQHLLFSFQEVYRQDIVAAFRRLQEEGAIEVLASAATHGYLPLLSRPSSIRAQVRVGVQAYQRYFGRKPRAFWLPECAYKPGLEEYLAEEGINVFFTETHTVAGGTAIARRHETIIGPYGSWGRTVWEPSREPGQPTTYSAYSVGRSRVAAIGRHSRTSMQVWSQAHGYPGDFWYREFHKKHERSGLWYWRVSGRGVDLGHKEPYDPAWAADRVASHAGHFVHLLEEEAAEHWSRTGQVGLMTSMYDTELFGHWWFEGVDWLSQVYQCLARSRSVIPVTPSEFLAQHPPERSITPLESSWGKSGDHSTWLNAQTQGMWPLIHAAEARMERLAQRSPSPGDGLRQVLTQAARELLLLESSDWPFLITTGQAGDYATQRFQEHLGNFNRLADIAEAGRVRGDELRLCAELWEKDKVFPLLDYRVFAGQPPQRPGPVLPRP